MSRVSDQLSTTIDVQTPLLWTMRVVASFLRGYGILLTLYAQH